MLKDLGDSIGRGDAIHNGAMQVVAQVLAFIADFEPTGTQLPERRAKAGRSSTEAFSRPPLADCRLRSRRRR